MIVMYYLRDDRSLMILEINQLNMIVVRYFSPLLVLILLSTELVGQSTLEKFEPQNGKILLFVGQELDAIGGLDEYNDGYFDHFRIPAGFTMYTNIQPINGELQGVLKTDNWGDGDSNMSLQIADSDFDNSALAIGLYMVGSETKIANGELDEGVNLLGEFLLSLDRRPVFLRIGYEFAGPWNGYDREYYKKAFRYIRDYFDRIGVRNVAYVWQSHGTDESFEMLESWYPGDEYVDWCGYSFFGGWREARMIEFARSKNKPVFIAEASPIISDSLSNVPGKSIPLSLKNPQDAEKAWNEWFQPFFTTINNNSDVVKAISYINAQWYIRPLWASNPTFQHIDARLQTSSFLSEKWSNEIYREQYLHADSALFESLWNND